MVLASAKEIPLRIGMARWASAVVFRISATGNNRRELITDFYVLHMRADLGNDPCSFKTENVGSGFRAGYLPQVSSSSAKLFPAALHFDQDLICLRLGLFNLRHS